MKNARLLPRREQEIVTLHGAESDLAQEPFSILTVSPITGTI
jgi:hypothetical protein